MGNKKSLCQIIWKLKEKRKDETADDKEECFILPSEKPKHICSSVKMDQMLTLKNNNKKTKTSKQLPLLTLFMACLRIENIISTHPSVLESL